MYPKIITFLILNLIPIMTGATTYTLLEPIGGAETVETSNIGNYVGVAYTYTLTVAVALAVLMLVIAGVEYTLSWTSESQKGKAKERINSAIIGLLLALASYLILQTINPKLVTFTIGQ